MLDMQSLNRSLYNIEMAAGTGWLEEHTHRIKDVEEKKGSRAPFSEFTGLGVPPLAYIWYKAREILALGYVLGSFKPGYWGLTAAWLGKNIEEVTDADGFASLMGRLKGTEEFRVVYCELYIAAGYLTKGARVSFAASGSRFTVDPDLMVFCQAGVAESEPASYRAGLLLQKYHELAGGLVDNVVSSLIYQNIMLSPGEEPVKVLAELAEKMSGPIMAGRHDLVLTSSIMEGTPGKERLRVWSKSVGDKFSLPSGHSIYLPRLTYPA